MNYSFFSRIKVLSFFVLLFAAILVSKLFLLQVVHSNSYSERADRQYVTPSSNIFERGTIYFERKDGVLVSAATQITGFKIAINPQTISKPEEVYSQINTIVPLDHTDFMIKASKKNDPYEEVADRLSKSDADAVSALKIKSVSIHKEKWRFYPGAHMASHALGLVGFQGNELAGRYGLESKYNNTLSRSEDNPYVNFFAEVFSNIGKTIFTNKEEREGDLVTTIEPSVQGFLDTKLSEVAEKYNTDMIGGIIMDPHNGSIYGLTVKPDFNPNDFSKIKNPTIFSNPLVENVLEFGSVIKPLVMAAGLDTGVVTAKTTYTDNGSVVVDNHQIFNFDKKARGANTSMQDVLNQSLNTGMVFISKKLGHENMRNYLLSYGIGEKTGIDLPNETSGLVSNLQAPRDIEYANAAFGQGIALTPMELIRALASLSNGGNLVVPHVIKSIKYDDGNSKEITYPTTPTKITKETADEITRMMVTVMDKGLKIGLDHYSVAVKTGTAQVALETGRGYYEDRHTHSFIGFFPAYDPKFVVLLYAINPKGVPYASQTWSNPFLDIVKFLLNYYEVPPDR